MKTILCCDWGTSAFRLRLIDGDSLNILSEIQTHQGVSVLHQSWMNSNSSGEKLIFFVEYLESQIQLLFQQSKEEDSQVPIVVSGMATSSIGPLELPYARTPFPLSGESLVYQIEGIKDRPMLWVSGMRTQTDVMRGEEVQLIGLHQLLEDKGIRGDYRVLLPGTHSKHVGVKANLVQNFTTYLTGELYAVFSNHSLLKEAVEVRSDVNFNEYRSHFVDGVSVGREQPLSSALFRVRTQRLFEEKTPVENAGFLSGLLIGAELRHLGQSTEPLILACGATLLPAYQTAMEVLQLDYLATILSAKEVDQATIRGQKKVAELFLT